MHKICGFSYVQLLAHFTVELMVVVAYGSVEIVARNSVPLGSTSIIIDRIEASGIISQLRAAVL